MVDRGLTSELPKLEPITFRAELDSASQVEEIIGIFGKGTRQTNSKHTLEFLWRRNTERKNESRQSFVSDRKSTWESSAVQGITAEWSWSKTFGIVTTKNAAVIAVRPGVYLTALCAAVAKIKPDTPGPKIFYRESGDSGPTTINAQVRDLQVSTISEGVSSVCRVVHPPIGSLVKLPSYIEAQAGVVSELTEGMISADRIYSEFGFAHNELASAWNEAMNQKTAQSAADLIIQEMYR